jgi:hypothetical protein
MRDALVNSERRQYSDYTLVIACMLVHFWVQCPCPSSVICALRGGEEGAGWGVDSCSCLSHVRCRARAQVWL